MTFGDLHDYLKEFRLTDGYIPIEADYPFGKKNVRLLKMDCEGYSEL